MVRKKSDSKAPSSTSKPLGKSEISSKTALAEECVHKNDTLSLTSRREKVALLAYSYWEQRGCLGGSPEEDWYRAEREVDLRLSTL